MQHAAVWRWVYVGESRAQAEDELAAALVQTRRHMKPCAPRPEPRGLPGGPRHAQPVDRPGSFRGGGIRFALRSGALIGTARDVAEQVAELRDAGVGHLLCQMSFGYLEHERIKSSMRRFGETVIPAFA